MGKGHNDIECWVAAGARNLEAFIYAIDYPTQYQNDASVFDGIVFYLCDTGLNASQPSAAKAAWLGKGRL